MKRIILPLVLFGCFAGSAFGASNDEIFDRVIDYAAKNSCGDARWYADKEQLRAQYQYDPNTKGRIYELRRETKHETIAFARVYVDLEGYPDDCEKIKDYGSARTIFLRTEGHYPYYTDMNRICREEFGAGFRMADWGDIEHVYASRDDDSWAVDLRKEYNVYPGYGKMMNDFGRQELNPGWISVYGERIAPQTSSGGTGHYHIILPDKNLNMIKTLGKSASLGYRASEDSGYILCIRRESVPAPQTKPVPPPAATQKVERFPFRLTQSVYSATKNQIDQINNACAKEFGSSSRIADYNDLTAYKTGMPTLDGFVQKLNAPNERGMGDWAFVGLNDDGVLGAAGSTRCFSYIGYSGYLLTLTSYLNINCKASGFNKKLPVLCFEDWPEKPQSSPPAAPATSTATPAQSSAPAVTAKSDPTKGGAFPFKITKNIYEPDSTAISKACASEFGGSLADWNDILQYYKSKGSLADFFKTLDIPPHEPEKGIPLAAFVSFNSNISTKGYYFILSRHDGNPSEQYISLKDINSHELDLSIWSEESTYVLCKTN